MPGLTISDLTRWFRGGSAAGGSRWAASLATVIGDLTALNGATETDFLEVGKQLGLFVSAAAAIRAEADGLAESLAGEAGEHAGSALQEVLTRSAELQTHIGDVAGRIHALRGDSDQIRHAFDGLAVVALSFHVTASLGRIETARLGGVAAELNHLGDEVRSCADSIQDRARRATEMGAALEGAIQAAIGRIAELSSAELAALPGLAQTAHGSLEELRTRRSQAQSGSAHLAERFAAFSDAIGVIVTALQFHDITRQQLEHVIAALGAVDRRRRRPSPQDAAVLALQGRQLAGAAATFAQSVRQVGDELARIATAARQIAGDAGELAGAANSGRESFFTQLEQCFAAILSAVATCGELESETAAAVVELRRTVKTLAECAAEIREVGRGIHHLAVNTMIQAVQLGGGGEPLGVVADAMQTLQLEAAAPADRAALALAGMENAIAGLIVRCKDPAGERFFDGLESRIASLHSSGEAAGRAIERIASATAELCADVERAARAFQAGARFAEICGRSGEALQRIVAECGGITRQADASLEDVAARYTMQSERDVHHRALDTSPAAAAADLQGGDIELF